MKYFHGGLPFKVPSPPADQEYHPGWWQLGYASFILGHGKPDWYVSPEGVGVVCTSRQALESWHNGWIKARFEVWDALLTCNESDTDKIEECIRIVEDLTRVAFRYYASTNLRLNAKERLPLP